MTFHWSAYVGAFFVGLFIPLLIHALTEPRRLRELKRQMHERAMLREKHEHEIRMRGSR